MYMDSTVEHLEDFAKEGTLTKTCAVQVVKSITKEETSRVGSLKAKLSIVFLLGLIVMVWRFLSRWTAFKCPFQAISLELRIFFVTIAKLTRDCGSSDL